MRNSDCSSGDQCPYPIPFRTSIDPLDSDPQS
jgi:hypothetical protein